jgi:vancomycin permeability regulator SanA
MKLKLTKRKKRVLLVICGVTFITVASPFIINVYVKYSVKSRLITVEEAAELKADCILVLGCGLNQDGTPSPMLGDRLQVGTRLYEEGASARLLMSGDHGREDYDEVNAMKTYAVGRGIPSENIFMDHAGFSTYESIYRARDVFKAKKIILVSQKYHLYRGLYIARALGLDAYGVAADMQSYAGQKYYETREVVARVKDFLTSIFKPRPTFLGEAIPVNGNGNITNDKDIYNADKDPGETEE